MRYQFPEPLRLLDHKQGKYPYEVLFDFPVLAEDGSVVTVVPGRCGHKEGYRTDLASIPTRTLKKLMEPTRVRRCYQENPALEWPVYLYEEGELGLLHVTSVFTDPIAYAAVPHDAGYSLEIEDRALVDRRFFDILTQGEVPTRWLMYLAVRIGGWPSFPHPAEEVTEDRILFAEALDRYNRNLLPEA